MSHGVDEMTAMQSMIVPTRGVQSDPLLSCAIEAWATHAGYGGAADRREHVKARLRGELTWRLIEDHAPHVLTDAIDALLRRAAEVRSAGQRGKIPVRAYERSRPGEGASAQAMPVTAAPPCETAAGGGHCARDTQVRIAPAGSTVSATKAAVGGGHARHDAQNRSAPSLKTMADKQAAATQGRAATIARLSMLDKFKVNGQPIGDLTPVEAVAWAASRERDVRFVKLLTAGVPEDRRIRDHVRPDEADKLYERAQKGGDA